MNQEKINCEKRYVSTMQAVMPVPHLIRIGKMRGPYFNQRGYHK